MVIILSRSIIATGMLSALLLMFSTHSVDGHSLQEQLEDMDIDSSIFQYRDLYTLTSANFSTSVMGSFDPWVVVLHKGSVGGQWKEAAVQSRGVVWFGMVNVDTEKHLVREMKIRDLNSITEESDIARVYPWGKQAKTETYRTVHDAKSALNLAYQAIPTEVIKSIEDSEDLNDLVMDCLLTAPTRFPAIFIYDPYVQFPPSFNSISLHLRRYFNFGKLDVELAQELVDLGVKREDILKAPTLIAISSKVGAGGKIIQRGIPCKLFDEPLEDGQKTEIPQTMPSYTKMLECLYNINSRYRVDLPGNNMAEDEEVTTMEDVLEQEQRRFQVIKGPAILASEGRKSNMNIEVVKERPPHIDPKVEL